MAWIGEMGFDWIAAFASGAAGGCLVLLLFLLVARSLGLGRRAHGVPRKISGR